MSHNSEIINNINTEPFIKYFTKNLQTNVSIKVCKSLANLLAIDYKNRLNSTPELTSYLLECFLKIKTQLNDKKIEDESFQTIMSLFITAITPEHITKDDDFRNQEQSQEALINAVISEHFSGLTIEESSYLKILIKDIINAPESKEMMEIVISDPKIFYSMVVSSYKKNKKEKDALRMIYTQLISIVFKNRFREEKKKYVLNKLDYLKNKRDLDQTKDFKATKKTKISSKKIGKSNLKITKQETLTKKQLHTKEKNIVNTLIENKTQNKHAASLEKKDLLEKIKNEKLNKNKNTGSRSV